MSNGYRRHGLTGEAKRHTFDTLFQRQQGKCLLCGITGTGHQNLYIDHCHTTGAIRGLLCPSCNSNLGMVESTGVLHLPASEMHVISASVASWLNRYKGIILLYTQEGCES